MDFSLYSNYIPWLTPVLAELSLLCLASLILIVDVYLKKGAEGEEGFANYKITYILAQAVLIITGCLVYSTSIGSIGFTNGSTDIAVDNLLLFNMISNSPVANLLKLCMIFFIFICFQYADKYLTANKIRSGEFYVLGLFSLLGMMVLVCSTNLLTLYLGLELFSLPLYAMVAILRNSIFATEAAVKYFVMGAITSGLLLFGISLIYGISGTLVMSQIANTIHFNNPVFLLGIVFIAVGIAFKFGAAPFHMWTPDVYQGAPTATTLFISTAPKLAAFGMTVQILTIAFANNTSTFTNIFLLVALVSIAWGNIAALMQTNIKRLLAYSSIGHMGFILLGFVTQNANNMANSYASALFYVITYVLMSLAFFGFITSYRTATNTELSEVDDYKGLFQASPWIAVCLMMLLFSMAGVPPFMGFFAKMTIILSLVDNGLFDVAIFVVLMSVVGAYYYIKIIWLMFFENTVNVDNFALFKNHNGLLFSVNSLAVLILGIFNNWLFVWCLTVFK